MIDFTTKLPEMKSGNELISALSIKIYQEYQTEGADKEPY